MCGFAGWFDLGPCDAAPPGPSVRVAALRTLARRGPDGEGTHLSADGRLCLIHRRLAVVDLEGGAQPMAGPGPGEVLAWNGELFDHDAHRRALTSRGAALRTRSDTEVLAHLFASQGADALTGLRAQYALAWSEGQGDGRSLLLARDPAGEKPLYWTRSEGRIWFASRLDTLRVLAPVSPRIDREALSFYLSWGFVPAPLTIFEGVRKLPAGEWLLASGSGDVRHGRVAAGPAADAPPAGEEVDALREVLHRAARARLVSSDVPVGVFLSSGLDSVAVTAVLKDAPGLRTYTVRATDPRFDESELARSIANSLGVAHEVIDPPATDAHRWQEVFGRHGEPFGSTSALAVDAVARAARQHVTVALTGDGGDEALGGYPRHVVLRRLARFPRMPAPAFRGRGWFRRARRAAELLALDGADRYAEMYEVFGPWRGQLTPGDDGAPARGRIRALWRDAAAGDLDAMLRVDRSLELPDSHCVKVDVACMENGLEPRSPWLDPEVVALCDALPPGSRMKGGATKRVLRELLARELPPRVVREVLRRPKRGFTTGFDAALGSPEVRERLLSGALGRVGGIETAAVEALLAEHAAGTGNHVYRLAVLLGLAVFAETSLPAEPQPGRPSW